MMKVIFDDTERETYTSVGNVIQFQSGCAKIHGRLQKVWNVIYTDGTSEMFPQKRYHIERIEI